MERYERFFRHSFIPDESFFQTVIMNSDFRGTVVNDYLRTINMQPKGVQIFRERDYDFLVNSGGLFARKFDEAVDPVFLDRLEQRLFAKSDAPAPSRHAATVSI